MKNSQLKVGPVILLMGFFCLYSCNVYHTAPATVSEAVDSGTRVRILTKDNSSYEFKNLYEEENHLVGITGRNSETAKLLTGHSREPDGKNIKIKFQKDEVLAIYLKDRKMSRLVNIGVPVVGVAGIVGLTNPDFRPGVGY